jgi:hypothetical protein
LGEGDGLLVEGVAVEGLVVEGLVVEVVLGAGLLVAVGSVEFEP